LIALESINPEDLPIPPIYTHVIAVTGQDKIPATAMVDLRLPRRTKP